MRFFHGDTQLVGAFQIDGTKFPANWLALATPEDLERWGITTLPDLPAPVPSLADAKASKIATINVQCRTRITLVWPLEKQLSALAGIYGTAEVEAMTTFIDEHIAASNAASDAVDAATTLEAVEAVTVTWPV